MRNSGKTITEDRKRELITTFRRDPKGLSALVTVQARIRGIIARERVQDLRQEKTFRKFEQGALEINEE